MDTHRSRDTAELEWEEPPRKRMRTVTEDNGVARAVEGGEYRPRSVQGHHHLDDHDKSMTIASTAKLAPQAVAPFFAKHIPSQYAPLGDPNDRRNPAGGQADSNSKYCYRHRPDMLCRRQADEPVMEQLQKDLEQLTPEDRQGIVQVWSLFSAAPSKHRNLMLQGILAQCCFPQLSFLSANVRELIRIDYLAALPSEIAFRILCFLDTTSLCKAAQVSRKWRQLADDDVVWHRMCEQHIDRKCTRCGWGLPLLERKRLREYKRQAQLRASGRNGEHVSLTEASDEPADSTDTIEKTDEVGRSALGQSSLVPARRPALIARDSELIRRTRPWKDVYKDRFKVGTNWKYGRFKPQILKGHTNGVMAVHMYDNILATGSYDSTIKIWDMETGEELRTLYGHTLGIRSLQIDSCKVISGSLDKTLKVWNWRTGECIASFRGHSAGIIGLDFDSNVLVSGSMDHTARVWNFNDKSYSTLKGHTNWVNAVRIDTPSRTVFTASDDCSVKLWDLDTKKCIHTFEGHVAQVQQVVLLPQEFEVDDESPNNRTPDPGSPDSLHTVGSSYSNYNSVHSPELTHRAMPQSSQQQVYSDPFASFDESRPRPPRYMLTSGLDSTIRLWDIYAGRSIRVFFGHVEGVWALAADTLRIVSGAEDSMVKVWDPRSGKCEGTFTGHRGPVTCIALSDSRIVSAGEDGEVRVYGFGH